MSETSGVDPSKNNKPSSTPSQGVNPNLFSSAFSSAPSGDSWVEKAWGFDAAQAKKFISTLANTIIAQIKHEDEKVKETMEKLKEAEQGEDDSS